MTPWNKCQLPSPHGRVNSHGRCMECHRLRAIVLRNKNRKHRYVSRKEQAIIRAASSEIIINAWNAWIRSPPPCET